MDYDAYRAALLVELERHESSGKTDRAEQVRAEIARIDVLTRRDVPAEPEAAADSKPLERAVPRKARKETR